MLLSTNDTRAHTHTHTITISIEKKNRTDHRDDVYSAPSNIESLYSQANVML